LAVSRRLRDENWGRFTQPGEERGYFQLLPVSCWNFSKLLK
jgi:hypothetical protein